MKVVRTLTAKGPGLAVDERIAVAITRVFRTMGLILVLLLGTLGVLHPAAAQPVPLGDAALLTPAAAGDSLEPATFEGFTKVGFRSHRGFRRGYFRDGRSFRGHGFGQRRFFGRTFKDYRYGGCCFGKRRFFERGFKGHHFGGHGFGRYGFKRSF